MSDHAATPDRPRPPFGDTTRPLVVVTFEGWGDGGESASTATDFISTAGASTQLLELDCDGCYDLLVERPRVVEEGGRRVMRYPAIRAYSGQLGERQLLTIIGPEPSMHWPRLARQIGDVVEELDPEVVLFLGAYLAPTPHTRPVPVNVTGAWASVAERFGLEASTYEGPAGMLSALGFELEDRGVPAASLWAAVPNYLMDRPCMNGALALVRKFVELTAAPVDVDALTVVERQETVALDAVAEENSDLAQYVGELEARYDAQAASGEAIAAQLEAFLRDH